MFCIASAEEDQPEPHGHRMMDGVLGDDDAEELMDHDALQLTKKLMPLLGDQESEKRTLTSWLRLPRRARVAIRRLHRNLRHLPKEA